jgi:hypothetical protein
MSEASTNRSPSMPSTGRPADHQLVAVPIAQKPTGGTTFGHEP